MSDYDSSEERPSLLGARSARDIKANILSKVWMTSAAAEKIQAIQERHRRVEDMPIEHVKALGAIIPDQPKCVMRFNAQMYREGKPHRLAEAGYKSEGTANLAEGHASNFPCMNSVMPAHLTPQ
ncbi:MAG: hypothetical protein JWO78_113 [Micavibrio sp.]|nr:hypothetical protein [Micavibrio sp.]